MEAQWIIPAHAGFTPAPAGSGAPYWDHPRTRGVYDASDDDAMRAYGSSPHTRGLHTEDYDGTEEVGIIPAHAGFTRGSPPSDSWAGDHPRTRGVYASAAASWAVVAGSSPHTRGLPFVNPGDQAAGGIIPAHAGFTRGRT